jgi:filamentous hemagglutinin family protein
MMTRHPPMAPQQHRRIIWLSSSSLLLVLWLAVSSAQQVRTTLTPDGTLGTTVTPHGNVHTIAGGMRPGNGPNLFHSFDRFSVGTNDTANFTGPAGITHILSRVTGGQRSEIDGKLQSTIPGAHLYLLNPSGVVFGLNATLDVQGSFHVSTAEYLRLADGARFFTRLSAQSTFSVAPPVAFGFLGPTPAPMTVNGSTLQVPRGETVSLVGGEITIAGNVAETAVNVPAALPTLGASEGRIHLVSVASAGEVASPLTGQPLDLEVGAVARLGRLHLSRGALVDVSTQGDGPAGRVSVVANDVRLENGHIVARTTSRGAGGELAVRAGTLTLNRGAEISVSTMGEGPAGRATVKANDVHIENGQISATASSRGDGGEITVEADTVMLKGRDTPTETFNAKPTDTFGQAQLSGQTKGEGRGGRVRVVARDLRLEDGKIRTRTLGEKDSGEIEVQAGTLTLTGQAQINGSTGSPDSTGRGGNVTVRASEALVMMGSGQEPARIASDVLGKGDGGRVVVSAPTIRLENGRIVSAVNESGFGNGGEVAVRAGTLTLTRGARISSSTSGAGNGGTVTVAATEAIIITDAGSVISSETSGGNAGRVVVSAPTVHLEAGGSITTAVAIRNARDIPSFGNAGEIEVRAGTLTLTGGAQISSSTAGVGHGGRVTVVASDMQLENGSISAITEGNGQGGEIAVQAGRLALTGGAQISSSSGRFSRSRRLIVAGSGDGGNVTISATEALTIVGQDPAGTVQSAVVSQTLGAGNAGQVTITTPRLTMAEGGRIGTDTGGDGRAGSVRVEVGSVAIVSGAQISSRSGTEVGGTLRVGTGAGGTVTLTATEGVTLAGQGSGLSASTAGQGQGGNIVLQTQQVQLTDGAAISAQGGGAGPAGDITLNVGDLLAQGAMLTSSSTGAVTGNAGTVTIQGPGGTGTLATRVTLIGSVVATDTSVADGGDIQVRAQDMLRLRDSQITTAVSSGEGRGGNIFIDPEFVILERSQIRADAFGGPGGNIRIMTQGFVADATSQVSASSARNVEGRIDIPAFTTPSGLVAPLPLVFASAATLLRSACAARLHEGTISTLVERGRAGVPATPDGVLPSRLPLASLDTATSTHNGGLPSAARVSPLGGSQRDPKGALPPQGWAAPSDSLRLLDECASR